MQRNLIISFVLALMAFASLSAASPANSPHLPQFLSLVGSCDRGFLRFEPSKGCADADYAAVKARLCERFGSPSLNSASLVMWDRGTVIVSLRRGDPLNAQSLKVTVMVPEGDRAVVPSRSANVRAARIQRRETLPVITNKPTDHARPRE